MRDEVAIPPWAPGSPRVALVGAGALGSEIARRLMAGGLRKLLVIDPDRVEPHNVALSRIFTDGDVGRDKAEVIAETARELGWQAVRAEIADVGLAVLRHCDVLLSATDSALSRVETAFAARALRMPMLDAGVHSHGIPEGRVSCLAATSDAACYLCGFSDARRAELLAFALSASLGCRLPAGAEPMTGTTGTVDATASALVALLGEHGTARAQTSFALRLHTGMGSERIELTRSPGCPWHTLPSPDRLVEMPYDQPVRELLAPDTVLELPWPVCLHARCRHCGHRVEPLLRTARVRRTLPCSGCGRVGTLDPLESLQTLAPRHPLSARTPRELCLPERQLYHRRRAVFSIAEDNPSSPVRIHDST